LTYTLKYYKLILTLTTTQKRGTMKKVLVKENNGGGLSIELWIDGNIDQVVTGLEFGEPLPVSDIVGFGDTWTARDASNGYDLDGNTLGDLDENHEKELTAEDIWDDSKWTRTIATYDGADFTLTIAVDELGNAGRNLFKI
jgi:hypothetical protein